MNLTIAAIAWLSLSEQLDILLPALRGRSHLFIFELFNLIVMFTVLRGGYFLCLNISFLHVFVSCYCHASFWGVVNSTLFQQHNFAHCVVDCQPPKSHMSAQTHIMCAWCEHDDTEVFLNWFPTFLTVRSYWVVLTLPPDISAQHWL